MCTCKLNSALSSFAAKTKLILCYNTEAHPICRLDGILVPDRSPSPTSVSHLLSPQWYHICGTFSIFMKKNGRAHAFEGLWRVPQPSCGRRGTVRLCLHLPLGIPLFLSLRAPVSCTNSSSTLNEMQMSDCDRNRFWASKLKYSNPWDKCLSRVLNLHREK